MKRITKESIKELLEAKIVYYRKLQDRANSKGEIEKREMYKFFRWSLEEILEELDNRDFHISLDFYQRAIEEIM